MTKDNWVVETTLKKTFDAREHLIVYHGKLFIFRHVFILLAEGFNIASKDHAHGNGDVVAHSFVAVSVEDHASVFFD